MILVSLKRLRVGRLLLLAGTMSACAESRSLTLGASMELHLDGMAAVDGAAVGHFEVWVHSEDGAAISVGQLTDLPDTRGPESVFAFDLPLAAPTSISVTLEPPGDQDSGPSPYVLMAGPFDNDGATLSVDGQVTEGPPFEPEPGSHSLFTTSNNVRLGYPSFEESGIWMFTMRPRANKHGTREVRLTVLQPSWVYEGWIVRNYGTPEAVWISFGKYRPDFFGLLTSRDDTGSGPFSGDEDYLNAGVEDVPGDEFTTDEVAEQLGFQLPGDLELPLLLNAMDESTGRAVWTHVITVEPAFEEDEPLYANQPFLIRPYRNAIGAGGPEQPRLIEHFEDQVPRAVVRRAQ